MILCCNMLYIRTCIDCMFVKCQAAIAVLNACQSTYFLCIMFVQVCIYNYVL